MDHSNCQTVKLLNCSTERSLSGLLLLELAIFTKRSLIRSANNLTV